MFGATAVRRKREKERRERVARNSANIIYPYIRPYGPKFDKYQLPYFKHRKHLHLDFSDIQIPSMEKKQITLRQGHVIRREENYNFDIILYIGLVMVSIGLIFVFTGLGEQQGYKTLVLKMTGPCTIIFGLFFIALRLTCCCVQSVKGTKIAELIECEHLLHQKIDNDDMENNASRGKKHLKKIEQTKYIQVKEIERKEVLLKAEKLLNN